MSTIQKQQENKYQKEYDEKFEEIKGVEDKVKYSYVKQLCTILQKAHPELKGKEIGDQVKDDCEERLGWERAKVQQAIPDFAIGEKASASAKTKWAYKNAAELEKINRATLILSKTEVPPPPEPKIEPISEEKLHDLGLGSYGESHKSIHRVRNEIHEGIRLLFKSLCDDKDLPNDQDDLIVDYIKPTREYRLGLAMEFDQAQRTNMHNKLHYVIAAAEDMIEQIEKADKK